MHKLNWMKTLMFGLLVSGTDVDVTKNVTINGEIAHTNFDSNDATELKIGSRYTVGKYYGEAGMTANDVNDNDGQGYYVGLGLSF